MCCDAMSLNFNKLVKILHEANQKRGKYLIKQTTRMVSITK